MVEYLVKIKLKSFPEEVNNIILSYLPGYKLDIIKLFKNNKIWFKRLIQQNIQNFSREDISYYIWYKIYHYKKYSLLIRYENTLIEKLKKEKSEEEIFKMHLKNLELCNKKQFMNY